MQEKQQIYCVFTQCHLHKKEKKGVYIQFANCLDVIIIVIMKMHIFNGLQTTLTQTLARVND